MSATQKNIVSAVAAFVLAAAIVFGFDVDLFGWMYEPEEASPAANTMTAATATVARVIDGDTFEARIGSTTESVRLIGIDSPEIDWPSDGDDLSEPEAECYGFEARSFLQNTLEEQEVRLVGDTRQPIRDDYNRRLAYVYVDGKLVNEQLLAGGFARELTVGPGYQMQEEFRQAEVAAQEAGRGLWAVCE